MKEKENDYPYDGIGHNLPDLIRSFKTHYENMIQPRYLINQKITGLSSTSVYIESEFPDGTIKTGIGTVYSHFVDIKLSR